MPKITLRAARVNAGLKLSDVAQRMDVSEKTLANWETGESEPRITQFFALCELYGIPYDGIILPKRCS